MLPVVRFVLCLFVCGVNSTDDNRASKCHRRWSDVPALLRAATVRAVAALCRCVACSLLRRSCGQGRDLSARDQRGAKWKSNLERSTGWAAAAAAPLRSEQMIQCRSSSRKQATSQDQATASREKRPSDRLESEVEPREDSGRLQLSVASFLASATARFIQNSRPQFAHSRIDTSCAAQPATGRAKAKGLVDGLCTASQVGTLGLAPIGSF